LDLVQEMALHVERSEAAITSEANSQMAELQAQLEAALQAAKVAQQVGGNRWHIHCEARRSRCRNGMQLMTSAGELEVGAAV
jgi:CII-binding regulator of phage lambda lysogenization HflD